MNVIFQNVALPKKFMSSYLKHIISKCKEDENKPNQTANIRIIAYFITNLIDHGHLKGYTDLESDVNIIYNFYL